MDADGSNQTILVSSPEWEQSPSWSPGGKRIVFESDVEGNDEIYIVNIDSGDFTRLTSNLASDHSPAWSPDGKRIAFVSDRDGKSGDISSDEIYVMNSDGSNVRRLTYDLVWDGEPAWSPDGEKIAFTSLLDGAGDIYVMDADGGNPKNLTNNSSEDGNPSWSPDGEHIIFTSWRDVGPDIYVMNAEGRNVKRITYSSAGFPAWSPDGEKIAFVSGHPANIYVMDSDGGNVRNLTNNSSISSDYGDLAWSPDGEKIAFTLIMRPLAESPSEEETQEHRYIEDIEDPFTKNEAKGNLARTEYAALGITLLCVGMIYLVIKSKKKTAEKCYCPECGAEVPIDSVFCGECGAKLGIKDKKERIKKPIGIIIACILLSLNGVFSILGSVLVLPYWFFIIRVPGWLLPDGRTTPIREIGINVYILIVGIGSLFVCYGLWKRRHWAKKWSYGVGFAIIGQVIIYILNYKIFEIQLLIIILLVVIFMIYLSTPSTKKYFMMSR
ncbi:MAG: DPP IV N-terminal domain-containing protein [Candidatus Methanofastidiosia archaeon]